MKASKLLTLGILGGSSDPSASFTVTTTGAQTLTIHTLALSAATTVDWGDGSSDVYTGSGARMHNYAGAGTWTVRILQPLNVTNFTLNSTGVPVTVNSANLKNMLNVTTFQLRDLPVGSSGTFNSADVAAWRPTLFQFFNMPTGYAGTFNSADVAAWRPTTFQLYSMPTATFDLTISAAADFAGWTGLGGLVRMSNMALSQAEVDAVLLGLYTAAQSRTVTGGTIDLSGSNAAPSGTYAAANPPTTGKAAAYELINDSNGVIAAGEEWTTITVTGGLP